MTDAFHPLRCAIVGGGAAGLMAAAAVLEAAPEAEIFLLERNGGLGKKVIISGGGRCNVTTGIQDVRTVLTKYPRGSKFLSSAMYAFPPEAVYAWFESHGVPLKIEPDLRCFPRSDDGKDIVHVFENLFATSNVRVLLKTDVVGIERGAQGGFTIRFRGNDKTLVVDKVVLTTGGQAYRHTGSTGDGYAFAISLGHSLTPLAPSLNAFFTREKWLAEISGLSFTRATITAKRGKGTSFTGPFLFTHRGVSGPAVFALSSLVAFEPYDVQRPLEIAIDLFPDRTIDALLNDVEKIVATHPSKTLQTVLAMFVAKSLAEICVRELSLHGGKRIAEVSKKELRQILGWLKAIPLHVIQRGAGDEFVTAGGVPLTEVNPKTMESKMCPGLFFAGEILDIDGFTGGFNLQASWATGRLAGENLVTSSKP
ncbi:MAG: HI0933 family protein [Candidatus Uhrbacteria bacterium GW2011_GWA2_53_10]|uniref:HI0933 family protein n=1 Tax=Candidatus Uhrbacteria bacterium GW2011_GWA2_53_10 TaxID=1618980 RepID=A0A0G2AKJ4_9BACT|nr:MAG: HI0933 family protein [Candidatus Uhrbacteria bacterium GW2011_GWA2_53_10]